MADHIMMMKMQAEIMRGYDLDERVTSESLTVTTMDSRGTVTTSIRTRRFAPPPSDEETLDYSPRGGGGGGDGGPALQDGGGGSGRGGDDSSGGAGGDDEWSKKKRKVIRKSLGKGKASAPKAQTVVQTPKPDGSIPGHFYSEY
jgi:hypothetical protein